MYVVLLGELMKYDNAKWTPVEPADRLKLTKTEAQVCCYEVVFLSFSSIQLTALQRFNLFLFHLILLLFLLI